MNVKQGQNKFCGPAVLSILTGLDTDDAERAIQKATGIKHQIKGVLVTDLIRTIKAQGLEVEQQSLPFIGSSLFRVCHVAYNNPGIYMVELPRHVVAIEVDKNKQIYFCDNHTKEHINIESSARLGQKVTGLWKIRIRPRFNSHFEHIKCTCHCGHEHYHTKEYRILSLKYVAA
jgi:hypothetical protein